MEEGIVYDGVIGAPVLVVGRFALSFFSLPRELADKNGRANSSQGETETKRIQEDDPCSGGWTNKSALVSDGTDQLSASISSGRLSM
jgi:hypothetical protein